MNNFVWHDKWKLRRKEGSFTLGDQIIAGVPREKKMLLNPKETQKENLSDVYMICSTYSTLNKVSPPICIVSTSNHKKFEAML